MNRLRPIDFDISFSTFSGKLFRSQRILAQLIKRINNSIQLLIALIFRLLQHDEHIKCRTYDVTYAVFILYI